MSTRSLHSVWSRLGECFSGDVLCEDCDLCESGQIHVFPQELPLLQSISPNLVTLDGITCIKKTNCYCPYYDAQAMRCTVYEFRPLCCRLYPLDVISTDSGVLSWVVYKKCLIVKELVREKRLDSLYYYVQSIEQMLPEGMDQVFRRYSVGLDRLERWLGDNHEYYLIKPYVSNRHHGQEDPSCDPGRTRKAIITP